MTTNLRHQVISAIGAVLVSFTVMGVAVGPARAGELTPVFAAQLLR